MRNFLGKSVDEAEAMFHERMDFYGEDLTFMGIVAFRYYIPAACRYIRSQLPDAHPPMIGDFATVVGNRLDDESDELKLVAPELLQICHEILARFSRFDESDELMRNLPEILKSKGFSEIVIDAVNEFPTNLREYITDVATRLTDLIEGR